jgi:hypothetical protein
MKAIHLAVVAVLLAGCTGGGSSSIKDAHSPASPAAKQLSGAEISKQFIGRSHQSVTSGGQTFTELLTADGRAKINIAGDPEATGDWRIADDVICVNYSVYGKECSIVKADDRWFWFIDSTKGTTNNRFSR